LNTYKLVNVTYIRKYSALYALPHLRIFTILRIRNTFGGTNPNPKPNALLERAIAKAVVKCGMRKICDGCFAGW